jgi:hypothetical protein
MGPSQSGDIGSATRRAATQAGDAASSVRAGRVWPIMHRCCPYDGGRPLWSLRLTCLNAAIGPRRPMTWSARLRATPGRYSGWARLARPDICH